MPTLCVRALYHMCIYIWFLQIAVTCLMLYILQ